MSLFFIGEAATVSSDGLKIEFDGAAITSPDTHRTHQTALTETDAQSVSLARITTTPPTTSAVGQRPRITA